MLEIARADRDLAIVVPQQGSGRVTPLKLLACDIFSLGLIGVCEDTSILGVYLIVLCRETYRGQLVLCKLLSSAV